MTLSEITKLVCKALKKYQREQEDEAEKLQNTDKKAGLVCMQESYEAQKIIYELQNAHLRIIPVVRRVAKKKRTGLRLKGDYS